MQTDLAPLRPERRPGCRVTRYTRHPPGPFGPDSCAIHILCDPPRGVGPRSDQLSRSLFTCFMFCHTLRATLQAGPSGSAISIYTCDHRHVRAESRTHMCPVRVRCHVP
eukprot:4038367-Prymnesium_polylepis.1